MKSQSSSNCVDGRWRDRPSTRHPLFFAVGPELFDLVQGEDVHVGAGLPGAVPGDEEFERLLEIELRGPAEVGVGAAGVELEVASLVRAGSLVEDPGGAVAPETGHLFGDPGDGASV